MSKKKYKIIKNKSKKMIDYNESRRIIKQAILDNKLVIFVGAGASFQSGLPLWSVAVEKIQKTFGKESPINGSEYLKIPQLYFNARGEKEYNDLIKDIFKYKDKNYNEIHELIVQLNPCNVITTNYDDFLERAFLDKGEFFDAVERDTDIPYAKNNRLIIKMHGGFTHNNFVLKEDDYLNYSNNFQLIEIYIKALIAKNVVLFIGYSYNDPDVKQIFNWIKNILGNDFQRTYMLNVQGSFDIDDANYYRNLGINIIYASECIKPFYENNFNQNTINFLKYLIDNKETDVIDVLYNEFRPLNELNYIMDKYIIKILREKKIANFTENNYSIITLRDLKHNELFDKFASDGKDERIDTILHVFNKSIINEIENIDKLFKRQTIRTFANKNF